MFCPYCGTELVSDASFCIKCGKQVVQSVMQEKPAVSYVPVVDPNVEQYRAQKEATRKSEINSLVTAISHFSQKAEQFKEYDYVCNRVNYYARGAKSALLVWGCIIATLAFFVMLATSEGNDYIPVAIMLLIPGIMMIIGGILMKVNNRKKKAYYKEKYAELSQELYNHYIIYPDCPVGPEYTNPNILQLFLNVLQSGRADTVKESINLIIDARHQARVQEYLSAIQRNTAEINATSKAICFFAASSFFLK